MTKTPESRRITPHKAKIKERRRKVLAYRQLHMNLNAIAAALGVTRQTVKSDLAAVMEDLHLEGALSAKGYLGIELQRLDMACMAIVEKVLEGNIQAIESYRKLCESRRKLLGLDPAATRGARGGEADGEKCATPDEAAEAIRKRILENQGKYEER